MEAAWHAAGGEHNPLRPRHSYTFVGKDFPLKRHCPKSAACQDVERNPKDILPRDIEDDENDADYIDEEDDEDEPCEYLSEGDLTEEEIGEIKVEEYDRGSEVESDDADVDGDEDHINLTTGQMDQRTMGVDTTGEEVISPEDEVTIQHESAAAIASIETLDPVSDEETSNEEDFSVLFAKYQRIEHLAGPGCLHPSGYSGARISAEQMRGCTTVQCLVRKTSDWSPEQGDQDFELASDYFLSGLSATMPSRDVSGPETLPKRHGVDILYPDTVFFNDVSQEVAMQGHVDSGSAAC